MNKRAKITFDDAMYGENQTITFGAKDRADVEKRLKVIANDPIIRYIVWLD